eukprot:5150629-Amphidinium_carterae.1
MMQNVKGNNQTSVAVSNNNPRKRNMTCGIGPIAPNKGLGGPSQLQTCGLTRTGLQDTAIPFDNLPVFRWFCLLSSFCQLASTN